MPIGEEDLPTPAFTSSAPVVGGAGAGRRGRVFQGGFYRDLHRMLGVASGTEVRRGRAPHDAGAVVHSLPCSQRERGRVSRPPQDCKRLWMAGSAAC